MNRKLDRRTVLVGAAALAAPFVLSGRARAERSITVGIYTAQQGEYVRKQIIPAFEAEYKCKVYTTQGVTLEQIALMRATRNNPKYSVMFIDDIGVDLAKKEGLIEELPADKIPNMARLYKRFIHSDGYGAAFAMSAAGLVYNSETGSPLASYGDLWDQRLRKRFLMTSPKSTQSLYLLIAAVSVETGKPYPEAQYLIEKAWDRMEALKPNVLSIFENPSTVMQIAQGQADIAGITYSKSL
jgi:putative spermidine/putrescine transport system substrate-binding protein